WLLLLLLTLFGSLFDRGTAVLPHVEALQQIPQLNQSQLALIAQNATARCNLWPQLCAWQLHLYEGHAFSVQLPHNVATSPESTTSTTSPTTEAPSAVPLIFTVPGLQNTQQLLIYAQVEPKRGRTRRRR
ncbi:hypothetical protein KR222_004914, partial [Zaprionus bogoriensis]